MARRKSKRRRKSKKRATTKSRVRRRRMTSRDLIHYRLQDLEDKVYALVDILGTNNKESREVLGSMESIMNEVDREQGETTTLHAAQLLNDFKRLRPHGYI